MNTIIEILTEKVSNAFIICGYQDSFGSVTKSDRPDLCQFQCNGSFAAAKIYKKAPIIIANQVTQHLSCDPTFKTITVAGSGFINMELSDSFLLQYLDDLLSDPHLGIKQTNTQETIFLDYGGPNAAKPLHVGHLRSAIIGDALKRLAEVTGRKTISDIHLGDWGLQMGLVIAELEDRDNCGENIAVSSHDWDTLYTIASQKSKENQQFLQRAREITAKFQKGDTKYLSLWQKVMKQSIKNIKETYRMLHVDFDLWNGESDAETYVPELIETLEKKHLLKESMGAKIVDVALPDDHAPIPPVIIKKSNGSNIYATTDLATIIARMKQYHPHEIWYIVDNRQSLYFTQIFRCARKAALISQDTALIHLCFGTMNGKDGKPYKTREGGVMKLSDFYQTVYEKVHERVSASAFSENTDKEMLSHKITNAAIKFGDLMNHRAKDYIFDLEKFTASEGKTGTFLLYTIARIHSLLKKADYDYERNKPVSIYTDTEKNLILLLALSNEKFELAYNEKAPNLICEQAYEIASAFSKFYSENHILTETNVSKKQTWIYLCNATKQILHKHLDVLGIEPVEFM